MSISALDSIVVSRIADREPVSFDFGGVTWAASAGSRDTLKTLELGGVVNEQELVLLVPTQQFTDRNTTPPGEQAKVTVYITEHGIPCHKDNAGTTTPTVVARITRVSRSGGAFTWTLSTSKR